MIFDNSDAYAHRSDLNDAAIKEAEKRINKRIDDILLKIERDASMSHMDPGDVQWLHYAAQMIRDAAPSVLQVIAGMKSEEHHAFRFLVKGLDELTSGLIIASSRLAATPSGRNFFGKLERQRLTDPFRKGRELKREKRSLIIDEELGRLIAKGLGGESLRSAIITILERRGVEASLSKPSLSTVNTWARNYRRTGNWKSPKRITET